jgi:hypothetical protein
MVTSHHHIPPRGRNALARRFLVCGGDGTVTWVLHEIEAWKFNEPRPWVDG